MKKGKSTSRQKKASSQQLSVSSAQRVIVEKVAPEIDAGQFPVKRVAGERVDVKAHVYTDGHEDLCVMLLYRKGSETKWHEAAMKPLGNDEWAASFYTAGCEDHVYTVEAWVDHFSTWRKGLVKKCEAAQDVEVDLMIGIQFLEMAEKKARGSDSTRIKEWIKELQGKNSADAIAAALSPELENCVKRYPDKSHTARYCRELAVKVERTKALYSTWYEIFPRSWSKTPGKHGTFKDCERLLPEIRNMGFDVLYLPPIHPIGTTNRKGKNNSTKCTSDDPGSPWAIGNKDGGHKAIEPSLGTLADFKRFIKKCDESGIEVAMDVAFQCSPDHPYVKKHPQWFRWRPDGTIQFAENPPKKYEDIYPINFETEDRDNLWQELKSVFIYWVEQGVKIFRVDNPHTKPFLFWDWVIAEVKSKYPDVLFLSEAFTRPKVMYRLAKGGFSQSYTYFTWRNTKREFIDYLTELTKTEVREYFRPNFWTNTPDILPEHLQYGGRPAFMMRAALAATLSSNCGMYGPAFELCVSQAVEGKEEYLNSEKYEIKQWDWEREGNIKDFIARLNRIRKENEALHSTFNINFCQIDNDYLLAYYKATEDFSNIILAVVNLDPYHTQSGWVDIPTREFGINDDQSYLAHDLISNDRYIWQGPRNYVELNPGVCPVHILRIHRRLHREQDFDYFM